MKEICPQCEAGQATSMAKFAGIELMPEQVNAYIFARKSLDKEFNCQSDQVLLERCLDDNQKIQFRKKFDNIFK